MTLSTSARKSDLFAVTKDSILRYDIKIQLKEIKIKEVCEAPFDDKEEIWGFQTVLHAVTIVNGRRIQRAIENPVLWSKSKSSRNGKRKGQSIRINQNRFSEIKYLTKDEVEKLELWIGGQINDYEPLMSFIYDCVECTEPQNNPHTRVFNINSTTRMNEINNLTPNSGYQKLTVGNDKILEMNYEEGNAICKSKVQAVYEISIRAY